MLQGRKTAVALEDEELVELRRIIIDRDKKEALRFLKKVVFDKVLRSQKERLWSHLDTGGEVQVTVVMIAKVDESTCTARGDCVDDCPTGAHPRLSSHDCCPTLAAGRKQGSFAQLRRVVRL